MPLQAGTRLGPYEVIALAGAGGMGEVYQARDTRLDRTVAVKVLASGHTGDAAARQRFEREARAISALSHPHICPLFDIGHHEGAHYPPANAPLVCDRSRDGRFIIYSTWWLATGNDLFVVPADGGAAVPFATRFDEHQARFSVDGRWVAYTSNQFGRSEIYVRAFPLVGTPTLVSIGGGEQPAWGSNGRELYYLAPDHTMMAAAVRPAANSKVGPPAALFTLPRGSQFEPALDGGRFLVNVINADAVEQGQTVTVLDWVAGLDNVDK